MGRISSLLFFMMIFLYPAEKEIGKKRFVDVYKQLGDGAIMCQVPLADQPGLKCNRRFANRSAFMNHKREAHEGVERKRNQSPTPEAYQRQLVRLAQRTMCPVFGCGKEMRKSSLYEHIESQHPGYKPYACSHCSMKFSKKRDASSHEKEHFNESEQRRFLKTCDDLGRIILTNEEADFLNRKIHVLNAQSSVTFQDYMQKIRILFVRELHKKGCPSDLIDRKVGNLLASYQRCPKKEGNLFSRKKEGIFTIPEANRYVVAREEKEILDRLVAETVGLQECESKEVARQLLQDNIRGCLERLQQQELDQFHIGQKRTAAEAQALGVIEEKYKQLEKRLSEICAIAPMYGSEYHYEFKEACLKIGEDSSLAVAGEPVAVGEKDLPYNVRWQDYRVEVINSKRLQLLQGLIDKIAESVQEGDDRVDYCTELRGELSHYFDGKQSKIDEYMIWFNRVFQEESESEKPVIKREILVVEEDQRLEITKEQQALINSSIKKMKDKHQDGAEDTRGLKFYEDFNVFKEALIREVKEHYNALLSQAEAEGKKSQKELDDLLQKLKNKYKDFKKMVLQLPCYGRDEEYRFKPGAIKVVSDNLEGQAGPAE